MPAPKSTTARRAPQDRKPKAVETGVDAPFTFRHRAKSFQLEPASEFLSVGWARKNRHLSENDQFFTIIEGLADDDALEAIDSMSRAEFGQFQLDFYSHNGVELGESEAS